MTVQKRKSIDWFNLNEADFPLFIATVLSSWTTLVWCVPRDEVPHLLLDGHLRRHLLATDRRLHRHAGLEGHVGRGVSAGLWGLHGA